MKRTVSVSSKMPTIGHDCVYALRPDYGIIGPGWIIRTYIVWSPIFSVGYLTEIVVAVEKYVFDTLFRQLLMQLPDVIVCLLSFLLPISANYIVAISLCGF